MAGPPTMNKGGIMMTYEELQTIKLHISRLNALFELRGDDPKYAEEYVQLIRSFLRIQPKETYLPMMEVMTLIKYQKPVIFQLLKNRGQRDQHFEFLTNITMDIRTAEKNLEQWLSESA
jgi:ABC-type microcin C transport system permease subunit YejB